MHSVVLCQTVHIKTIQSVQKNDTKEIKNEGFCKLFTHAIGQVLLFVSRTFAKMNNQIRKI